LELVLDEFMGVDSGLASTVWWWKASTAWWWVATGGATQIIKSRRDFDGQIMARDDDAEGSWCEQIGRRGMRL
jgi:hypothetical protein